MLAVDHYMKIGAPYKYYILDNENDRAIGGKIGRTMQTYNGVEFLDSSKEYGFYIKKNFDQLVKRFKKGKIRLRKAKVLLNIMEEKESKKRSFHKRCDIGKLAEDIEHFKEYLQSLLKIIRT